MPRTAYVPPAPEPARGRTTSGRPARARGDDRGARRAAGRRRWGAFLALIAVLAAIGAVGVALLSSSDGGGAQPVTRDQVEDQIQDLRQFIEDNTQ